jgi:Tfp pilus assembly protein PilF
MRYQVALSMRRLQASDLDGAEAAAQAALAINPKEPQAVFFLANVAEMRNQPEQALDLYMKTADLAEDSNPQLTVVAKMRYGMLLQQMNYSMGTAPAEAATAAATPAAAPAGTSAPASAATPENTPAP